MTSYRIAGLSPEPFAPWFALDDVQLRAHGMRRVVADAPKRYPCRVSLLDAEPGETLLLLPYEHHPCDGPYRASGPIYVREAAVAAATCENALPAILGTRNLSLRGYDAEGWMLEARTIDGRSAETVLQEIFAQPKVASVHAHNSRTGCFLCRIDRA